MKKIQAFALLVLVLLLAGTFACDSANPVAPTGTTLTIIANPTLIGISGGQSTITVTGFRPDGNALFPGTQIRFTTSLGTISPALTEVNDSGQATATLTSTGQSGAAMVSASTTAGDGMADIMVQIGDDDTSRPVLTITVAPGEISIDEPAEVIVDVRNADGSPFGAGGEVMLTASLGCFGDGTDPCPVETTVTTGSDSRATAPFFSLNEAGAATIRAFFGSATAEIMVTIENQQPSLLLSVAPDDVTTNQIAVVTVLARDENGFALGEGERIELLTNLGSFPNAPSGIIETDTNGRAQTDFDAGDRAGAADIIAILGNSIPAMFRVLIRDVVAGFTFIVDPQLIDRPTPGGMGETIDLTVSVQNSLGEAVPNTSISFFSDVGGVFTNSAGIVSPNTITTDSGGVAFLVLTVSEQQIPAEVMSFTVTASVIAETAPGIPRSQSRTITIRQ